MKTSANVQRSPKSPTVPTLQHPDQTSPVGIFQCSLYLFPGGRNEVLQSQLQPTEIFLGEMVSQLVPAFKYSSKRTSTNGRGWGCRGGRQRREPCSLGKVRTPGSFYSLFLVMLDVFPHEKLTVVRHTTGSLKAHCHTAVSCSVTEGIFPSSVAKL